MRLKKGDKVVVIAGSEKGKEWGTVRYGIPAVGRKNESHCWNQGFYPSQEQ